MLNVDCHWYRSSVLESSLTSISYLYMDCFKPLTTAPLKYTLGDVSAHVEALKTDGDISDALTLKWKSLALLGFRAVCSCVVIPCWRPEASYAG